MELCCSGLHTSGLAVVKEQSKILLDPRLLREGASCVIAKRQNKHQAQKGKKGRRGRA